MHRALEPGPARRLKVGLLVPGGVDRSGEYRVIPCLLWLLERLARQHEVHVFALHQEPEPSRYELLGATVHNIGQRWTRIRTVAAILTEHRRGPFDVLHAFWAAPPGTLAAVAGRLIRRPVVLHISGGEVVALPEIEYGGLRTLRGRLRVRLALRAAARVTAASHAVLERVATLGFRADQLTLGVDLVRWPSREPRARDRGGSARLVHVGSLSPVKDQRTLLRASAIMAERGVAFKLDIVGEDVSNGAIQRYTRELGLLRCVTFHGFLPHRRLRSLFEQADLLLVSSRYEAGPVVILEAAVAGVPTVGTAVGHIRDWAPEAAVAVPVADPDAMARETVALLGDEPRRLGIAAAAQARALRENADWTAERVLEIYRTVAKLRHGKERAVAG